MGERLITLVVVTTPPTLEIGQEYLYTPIPNKTCIITKLHPNSIFCWVSFDNADSIKIKKEHLCQANETR